MSSDPKNYFRFTFDEFTEYTVNIAQLFEGTTVCETAGQGLKQTKRPAVKTIHRIPQSNLLKVFAVSLEMSSNRKKYFDFTFDEFGKYF